MTNPDDCRQSIERLVGALIDADLNDGDRSRLREMLKADAGALDTYIDQINMHCMLEWQRATSSTNSPDDTLNGFSLAPELPTGPSDHPPAYAAEPFPALDGSRRTSAAWWRGTLLGLTRGIKRHPRTAAAVLIFAGVAAAGLDRLIRPPAATLVSTLEARWDPDSFLPRRGERLPRKPLHLKSGVARVRLDSGVVMLAQGPANFEVTGKNAVRLDFGKLTAKAPPSARGFTINAPGARIVDLGTEFGVDAPADHRTHAEVFVGRVDVSLESASSSAAPQTLLLKEGEAVEFSADAGRLIPAPIKPLAFITEERAAQLENTPPSPTLSQFDRWRAFSFQLSADPHLIVYYPIQQSDLSPTSLTNRAKVTRGRFDGDLVGVGLGQGRFADKPALRFDGRSRMRLELPVRLESFTLLAWVIVDEFRTRMSLLDSNGDCINGRIHWQLDGDPAELSLGVGWLARPESGPRFANFLNSSKTVPAHRWILLATTRDAATGRVTHYLDDRCLASELFAECPVATVGLAEIGNWDPAEYSDHLSRGFIGRLDELAIFDRAMGADELRSLYEWDKPQ